MSRFGGVPIEEATPVAGRFGGVPVEAAGQQTITGKQPEPSLMDKAIDVVTGNLRETETTQSLPSYYDMPEMNDIFSVAGWKTGLGTLMANPDEAVKVIKANSPDVQVSKDEKGNYVLVSAKDGKSYAIQPGLELGDIPKFAAGIASFTPAGRIPSIAGAGLAAAGTQAAIEGTQAATGGEFNPTEVATSGALGAAAPAVSKLVSSIRQPIQQATGAAPVAAKMTDEQFGTLVKKAASGGVGSQKAKETVASIAAVNPEAKAAAEKLGVDLPLDVLSDSRLLQETVGLSRSVKGSEQSVQWSDTIKAAREKADDVMAKIDASPDIATVSENIRQSLGKVRADLDAASKKIYDQVDAVIPKQSTVNLGSTQKVISDIISEVGEANLSGAEKRLYQLATDPNTTYGALLREKSQIGKAMQSANAANPYGSVETGTLKRLYGALADDQLEAVGSIAGPEARDNLRYANQLTAKRKGLEQRIVNAFGKEGEGSIATKLTAAIRTGSKGDITQLNKVIKTVPEPLRREALASAIMAQSRTARGDFSFGAFESMYQGMRKNAPVYAAISKELGPESSELLRSLYVVSKRINTAENAIPKTGAGSAALLNTLTSQGFISKVLGGVVGGTVRAAGPVARVVPGGGLLVDAAEKAVRHDGKEAIAAAGKLLTSPDFLQITEDIAKRGAEKAAQSPQVRKIAISPQFAAYANRINLPKGIRVREEWIRNAILSGKQFNQEKE